jgi:urease accessory protein
MKHARLALFFTLIPTLARAHPGHGVEIGGIGWGLAHPFTGLDHVLAMIAVGLWAFQLGRRARWLLPLTFVGAMVAGAALGVSGLRLPFVEPAILASVIGFGAVIACAARLPLGASAALISIAALFHGQAHASEMPPNAASFLTGTGFMITTALLLVSGLASGFALQRIAQDRLVRAAGVAIVSGAILIGLGVI